MVRLSPRQQRIVCEVTEWYVNKARPISSLELKKRGFDCSPATLRNEMHYLVQIGFLEQPHVSAGRIPDTPGYRLWIEKRKNRFSLSQRLWEKVRTLKRLFHKKKPFELARDLSYLTETFVVIEEKGYIFKEGWGKIWEREDVLEEGVLEELGYWIDRAEDILKILDKDVRVWIGEELEGCRRVGTVGKIIGEGRRVLFLGPKRQHYVKEIKILEELSSR